MSSTLGTKRGEIESAIKPQIHSSSSKGSSTPTSCLSSLTPTMIRPPAELAKATNVFSTLRGEDKSRLNSSVLLSGSCNNYLVVVISYSMLFNTF